jgi:hypothetical protein
VSSFQDSPLCQHRIDLGPEVGEQRGGVAIGIERDGLLPVPRVVGRRPTAGLAGCRMGIVEADQAFAARAVQGRL